MERKGKYLKVKSMTDSLQIFMRFYHKKKFWILPLNIKIVQHFQSKRFPAFEIDIETSRMKICSLQRNATIRISHAISVMCCEYSQSPVQKLGWKLKIHQDSVSRTTNSPPKIYRCLHTELRVFLVTDPNTQSAKRISRFVAWEETRRGRGRGREGTGF